MFGSLLEIVLTDENASLATSVARIWEPTAPVQPNIAAVVIVRFKFLSVGLQVIYKKGWKKVKGVMA